jgi:hypothetical protein
MTDLKNTGYVLIVNGHEVGWYKYKSAAKEVQKVLGGQIKPVKDPTNPPADTGEPAGDAGGSPPTEPGYYWWRFSDQYEWRPVQVNKIGDGNLVGRGFNQTVFERLSRMGGEWGGKIERQES